jgi:hypothetical protein
MKWVHEGIFSEEHRLFAVPKWATGSAQDIIEEGIYQFKCMKKMIQGIAI